MSKSLLPLILFAMMPSLFLTPKAHAGKGYEWKILNQCQAALSPEIQQRILKFKEKILVTNEPITGKVALETPFVTAVGPRFIFNLATRGQLTANSIDLDHDLVPVLEVDPINRFVQREQTWLETDEDRPGVDRPADYLIADETVLPSAHLFTLRWEQWPSLYTRSTLEHVVDQILDTHEDSKNPLTLASAQALKLFVEGANNDEEDLASLEDYSEITEMESKFGIKKEEMIQIILDAGTRLRKRALPGGFVVGLSNRYYQDATMTEGELHGISSLWTIPNDRERHLDYVTFVKPLGPQAKKFLSTVLSLSASEQ